MSDHLGPTLAGKPLHMFWLLDVSGSMSVDGKIEALNEAMREAVVSVRNAAAENPGVEVKVRAITFAHDAEWHIGEPVDIERFVWSDVEVVERGTTEMGRAIALATDAIREVSRSQRGLPPALVLVSDGKPTDLKAPSYGASLRALAEEPWGRKASRMAIGIGQDADMAALHHFIGHDEVQPLRAANAEELRHYLRWASTVVVDEGSRPSLDWNEAVDVPEAETEPPPVDVDEALTVPPPVDVDEAETEPPRQEVPELADPPGSPPTGQARRDLPPPPGHVPPPPPPPPPASEGGPVW